MSQGNGPMKCNSAKQFYTFGRTLFPLLFTFCFV